ncbi:Axonemal dynein light chain domain-containing protein 1 [Oryzias melastigma]|uniref:Axonemal dynein light chain domain-containing protein 1 n=1 Tax=Oryzias melastigma TaxID=30732 RepID=A0A834FHU7_ORYME|nr:Axonemal dynein light chain domain-containing protein 1 [Oryzias melastigma]
MSRFSRSSSNLRSSRPKRAPDSTENANMTIEIPECRDKKPPPVEHSIIPDELLVSLTSTVCNGNKEGHTVHRQRCESCAVRRPDAVWHHPLGRKKYKFFLEQPTSLTGAGRDISFLCDAMTQRKTTPLPPLRGKSEICETENLNISDNLIPEEFHFVKNRGIQCLKFYEDPFTVQLMDEERKLRVFPSLKPSGRQEAVELMRAMDDMLEKAGVDRQNEELSELSQMEGLLELVKVEQNIYNTVFHELIRQVTVGCAERGQVLAKLRLEACAGHFLFQMCKKMDPIFSFKCFRRQRYQVLLDRIPRRLKALHTETVAQKSLDRRLTEEIHRIKSSLQQLSIEASKIKDHDTLVCEKAGLAHHRLAEALIQTHTDSDVLQRYHELYELLRTRLEAQLLQMTEERNNWSKLTFSLALKLISVKKLHLVGQLHVSERGWFQTAESCLLHLSSKDAEDLKEILELTDHWEEELTDVVSQLKKTEHSHCVQISVIQHGITKWISLITAQNKCPDLKHEENSVEEIHADLMQWSQILTLLSEYYQGEKPALCQQTLGNLSVVQEKWLNLSVQLFERHPRLYEAPEGQEAVRKLERVLPELVKQLGSKISGDSGILRVILSLLGLVDSWVFRTSASVTWSKTAFNFDWQKLKEALLDCQGLVEEALWHFSMSQTDNKDKKKPNETEKLLLDIQVFTTCLSSFVDDEIHKLKEEVMWVHMAQMNWMYDMLLILTPDCIEEPDLGQEHLHIKRISLQTLDADAQVLMGKLDVLSTYITRSCSLILEENNPSEARSDSDKHKKLQRECEDWVETCKIILTGLHDDPDVHSGIPDGKDPADGLETEMELTICENPVINRINYDRNISQTKLGRNRVHLTEVRPLNCKLFYCLYLCGKLKCFCASVNQTDDLVLSPTTKEAQRAFSDLTSLRILQRELHDSEMRVRSAEQRALSAEEALQAALEKIQDLERRLQGRPALELQPTEGKF